MINTVKVVVAIAALWIAWLSAAPVPRPITAAEPLPPPARPLPLGGPYHGMAVQLYTGEDCWNRFSRLMPEIADLGADTVLLVVHAYQDHAGSMNLHWDGPKTPTPTDTSRMIEHAKHYGLRVILMPIVLLEYPRGSEWRGKIKPPDMDEWFRRYTAFMLHFAKLAEKHSCDTFMVGSELVGLESSSQRWRKLIAEVKQFYRGKLAYSANWDHYKEVDFWDELDWIGMTSYYQLSKTDNPSLQSVVEAWQPIKKAILQFQSTVHKPIVFTEIGWCSQRGASVEAWNYYRDQKATPEGLQEQAMLYEAFVKAWQDEPGVGGFIWWEWTPDLGGPTDYNYTPRGKPAEQVLRDWYRHHRARGGSQPAAQISTSTAPAAPGALGAPAMRRPGDLLDKADMHTDPTP